MKIKAVALDLDGTLINTEPYYFQLMSTVLKQELGYELTQEEYDKYFLGLTTLAGMENMTEVLHGSRDEGQALKLLGKVREIAPKISQRISPVLFDGAMELVSFLRERRIPFLLVTNARRAVIESRPQWYKMPELVGNDFSKLITFEDAKAAKPDPAPYIEAAKRLGVKPEEMLVVEDTDQGVEAGHQAGAIVARVHTESNGQENHHFTNLKQLVGHLRSELG